LIDAIAIDYYIIDITLIIDYWPLLMIDAIDDITLTLIIDISLLTLLIIDY
jgi:hypothetical protein